MCLCPYIFKPAVVHVPVTVLEPVPITLHLTLAVCVPVSVCLHLSPFYFYGLASIPLYVSVYAHTRVPRAVFLTTAVC